MEGWLPPVFSGRHIIVADEDPKMVSFESCDLVISNTKVQGADGIELMLYLRKRQPDLPIIYLANVGRSTPEVEAQLPPDVPILREPFTAEKLRGTVMLDKNPM